MTEGRTWDGQPISPEPPHGAAIVVYRRVEGRLELLMLHRAHHGPDYEGDWAWGCPSGARHPGEPIEDCARRELREEAGLDLECVFVDTPLAANWPCYLAEAPADANVVLSDEHDRFEWLSIDEAASRCLPAVIGESLRLVADTVSDGNPSKLDGIAVSTRHSE